MMVSARLFCIALLLVVAASSSRAEEQPHRQESQKPAYKLAGFEPTSLITDEAAIDQDQRLMVNLMSKGTKEDFLQAWRVYQDGAFSRPYALITLEKPLTQRVKIGTNITGRTTEGVYLNCEALVSADVGETTLKVRYRGTESLDPNTRCAVGANPNPITNGCLANTGAIVVLGDVEFTIGYVYDKSKDNFNDRSIEGMSRNTYKKMRACGNCPFYKDFKKFELYFGSATYANKYILAAFKGWFANFTHGDANFSNYDFDARAAAIQTATSFLTITQYTLQELEHSINNCEHAECREVHCLRNAIQSMEAGVAYYTGSLEGSDGTGKGYLLYALADEMCKIFKTCGPKGDKINGPSKVNIEIFEQFRLMQDNIRNHQCTPARKNKDRIAILMTIPLVQATLQQAFIGGRQAGASLVDEARGAAFAASVVPIVGQCKILDGEVIYDNMKTSKGYQTDFEEVKLAFESNYECMGLTCADVGGYWFNGITGGFYMDGFLPCGLEPPEPWTPGQVIGFVVASFAGAAFLYGVFTTCRYFYFFGMCKTLQKRARRKTPVTVRSNRGVQA